MSRDDIAVESHRFSPHRIAEVIVSSVDGPERRGSGYRITSTGVITAAHVVAHSTRIALRFDADRVEEWLIEAGIGWCDEATDLAVLVIDPIPELLDAPPVLYGRLGDRRADISVHTAGFPRWKRRTRADGKQFRELLDAAGTVSGLTGRREDRLEITVQPPGDEQLETFLRNLADGRRPQTGLNISPWEAMSGAAVWSGDHLIGIVAKHYRAEGLGRLNAIRIDHCLARAGERLDQLCGLLGIVGPQSLVDVSLDSPIHATPGTRHAHAFAEPGRLFTRYYRMLEDRTAETLTDLSASPLGKRLPQQITVIRQGRSQPVPDLQALRDSIRSRRRIIVSGPAGIGKTFLTSAAIMTANTPQDDAIPIIVRLDEAVRPERVDLEHLIEDYLRRLYRIPQNVSRRLMREEHLSILLDGLDRVRTDIRPVVASAIAALAEKYGTMAIAVTSRESPELDLLRAGFDVEFVIGPVSEDLAKATFATAATGGLATDRIPPEFRTPFAIVAIMQTVGRSEAPTRALTDVTGRSGAVADAYISACTALLEEADAAVFVSRLGRLATANRDARNSSVIQPDLIGPNWLSPTRRLAAVIITTTVLWLFNSLAAVVIGLPIIVSESATFALTVSAALMVAMGLLLGFWASHGGTQPADVMSSTVTWTPRDVFANGGWIAALLAMSVLGYSAVWGDPSRIGLGVIAIAVLYALGLGDRAPADVLGTYSMRIRSATAAWTRQGALAGMTVGGLSSVLTMLVGRDGSARFEPTYLLLSLAGAILISPIIARVRFGSIRPGAPRRTRRQWRAFYLLAISLASWFGALIAFATTLLLTSTRLYEPLVVTLSTTYACLVGALVTAILGASLRVALEPVLGFTGGAPLSPLRAERILERAVTLGLARRVGIGYVFYHDIVEDRVIGLSTNAEPSPTEG
jgi:hypothetical protein